MFLKTLCFLSLLFYLGCATQKPRESKPMEPVKQDSTETDPFIASILNQYPAYFDSLLKEKSRYRIQIIYTKIDRQLNNSPVFTDHTFNLDSSLYFYPASTVKMPGAILALQKLNELKIPGLNRNTTMITDAAYSGQAAFYNDPDFEDGRPTIAGFIKKIFLVSDNESFNRLYEFLGQEYFNSTLHKLGFDSVQILHRLNISLTEDQNRHTNPVKFYGPDSKLIYEQPLVNSQMIYQSRQALLGKGFMSGGQLVEKPFDFSRKNRIALMDLHTIMKMVLFPEVFPADKRFNLTREDYELLYKYMSMKPRESRFPQYDSSYTDAYSKLLMFGGKGEMDPELRIFNKEGDAYGFLTDVAYVVDFKNKVEFLLSATIYCNSDGIFNDDHYDYEQVGFPFLKNLGSVIYDYELKRNRTNSPDLSKFKINYQE